MYVDALVSGVPAPKREKRLLFMLQAFIDDSGSHPEAGALVLAGWLARVDTWKRFADEWNAALDWAPRLAYFKMNEAATLTDQFRDWSESRRDERLVRLHRIIEEFVIGGITQVIPRREYETVFGTEEERFLHNPYYLANIEISNKLMANRYLLGIADEPIKFIFDNQVMEMGKIVEAWDDLAKSHPHIRLFQGGPPSFERSIDQRPLQAADLLAWWIRRRYEEKALGLPYMPMPWKSYRDIPLIETWWTERRLRRLKSGLKTIWHPISGTFGGRPFGR
jgi:hypothetical protein